MSDCFFNYTSATELVTYSTNIGNGVNSVFVIPHNLGTKDISVTVRDTQTNLLAYPAIEVITLSSVSISFNFVPALTAYDVTIFAGVSGVKVEPFTDRVVINIDEQPAQNVTVSVSSVGESVNVDVIGLLSQWGTIIGVLSAQTDLWQELSAKALNINLISLSSQFINLNTFVQTYSALWEESADIIPTVTNYLSTNCILMSCLNVNGQMLSAGVPLHDIFLTSETESQTLSYTPSSYLLSISNSNSVNLSSINSVFAANSAKYEIVYSNFVSNSAAYLSSVDLSFLAVSGNWNTAYNIATAYQDISANFITNTVLNSVSSLLLPTSLYQSSSGNWQSTYLLVSALSASWEESTDIIPTVTNYLSTNNVLMSGLSITGNLSSTGSVISRIPLVFTTLSAYTLSLTDQSDLITINNSLSSFVYIPNDTTINFGDGSQVNITRLGSGTVTISALDGVVLRSADNRNQLRTQNSTATIVKLSANDWLLFGDIS